MIDLKLHGREEFGIQTFCTGLTHFLPRGGIAGVLVESLYPGI